MTRRQFTSLLGIGALVAPVSGGSDGKASSAARKVAGFFEKGSGVRLFCLKHRGKGPMFSAVFVAADGKVVVFDGGHIDDAEALGRLLAKLGGVVDRWFITHNHDDHFGALWGLMRDHPGLLPKIGGLHFSFPPDDWFEKHERSCVGVSRCFRGMLQKHKVWPRPLNAGDTFDISGVSVEVLNGYDLTETGNACNNSSICFSVKAGGRKLLVTGDIGVKAGERLVRTIPEKLRHDVVFMSHHGQHGADKAFYEAVGAKVALWPTPKWLWENDAGDGPGSGRYVTNYVKCWMQELGVKRHYVLCEDFLFL